MAANYQKKDGDWGSWALIVFLFAVQLWPVALVLLFIKLFAPDGGRKTAASPLLRNKIVQPAAAGQAAAENRAKEAARKVMKSPVAKKSNANLLKLLGGIFAAAGVLAAMQPAGYVLTGAAGYLSELLRDLAILAAGMGMLISGMSMDRTLGRFARYLAVIGNAEAMEFSQLSAKVGLPERKVVKDLQKMIEKGYFGGKAYLNMERNCFFRSGEADAQMERIQREKQQSARTPKEAEEGYSGILRSIRRANDQIADPVLTEKISHLEEITAKIFRAVEEDPHKQGKIDTFMNYYLPTTQKLLDAYAEFEGTGIEGENLRQAKERIQNTMDAIIAGFEHQLDELYRADVMDVDSDIRVMETMLNRDTASVEKDFGLGKKAEGTAGPVQRSTGKDEPSPQAADCGAEDVDLGGTAARKLGRQE